MKTKITAIVLCLSFIFCSVSNFFVCAESNEYEPYIIQVFRSCVNGKACFDNVLVLKDSKGNIFMSADDISKYTLYYFDYETQTFYFDEKTPKNPGLKTVKADQSKKTITTLGKKVELSDMVNQWDEVFFPIAETLPYLNANLYVANGNLCIVSDNNSLWQVLDGFNAEDYYFDMDKELYNGAFAFAYVATNYVVDTFFNPDKWRRALKYTSIQTYYYNTSKEYSDIMKDYMVLDSNALATMCNKIDDITDTVITGQQAVNSTHFLDYVAKGTKFLSDVDREDYYMYFNGRMYDIANCADFINNTIGNDEFLDKASYVMTILSNTVNCYAANQDCYQALDSVYSKTNTESVSGQAAKKLYGLYKSDYGKGVSILFDSLESALSNEVLNAASLPNPVTLVYNLVQVGFSIIGLDEVYESAAVLYYVNHLQNDGLDAFNYYLKNSDYQYDSNENLRLSLIYYLRMAQMCNDTLEKGYSYSKIKDEAKSYQLMSDKIDSLVADLLIAGESSSHDGIDKIADYVKQAQSDVKNVQTYDTLEFASKEIESIIENLGYTVFYSDFRIDNKSDIETVLISSALSTGYKFEDGCTIVDKVKETDQILFDDFHIRMTHDKKDKSYGERVTYKNGKYYIYGDWGRGDGPYTDVIKINTAEYIKSNLIFTTFTHLREYDDDIDLSDEYSYDSAVLYTGCSKYALVEYLKDTQTLSAERYQYYYMDFE